MKEQKANYIMHTHKKILGNTLYYYNDDEIIAHLKSDETFSDIYEVMLTTSLAVISSIVLPSGNNKTLNLHLIVKHEQKQNIGQWEYYIVPNFTEKTDLQKLLQALQISTGISKQNISEGIRKQLNE